MTVRLDPDFADLCLSPSGRGRFRHSRNRVRGSCSHVGRSVLSIISSTPSRLSYTSVFVILTTKKPSDSSTFVLSASCATSASVECVIPSTSIMSLPCKLTKSTTYRSMECCRRNFQPASRRCRNARQSLASALVCEVRSLDAFRLNRFIPLTRPLRGRPLPNGERRSTNSIAR
jgi:hypothetical protein